MTGIIIQARMGSNRLPGKILKMINGRPLLEHILFRLERLSKPAEIVIATTEKAENDVVEEFCRKYPIKCFRGSELNVLDRYYKCALFYKFDNIVRMTADNPFPDIDELNNLIDLHITNCNDFTECFSTLPLGVGMEIFSFDALEKSAKLSTMPHHFEHIDEYILENAGDFKFQTMSVPESKNIPHLRLTVDTPDDYKKACFIAENSESEYVTIQEAIRLCMQYA